MIKIINMDLNPAILHTYDKNRDENSFRMQSSGLKRRLPYEEQT